MSAGMNCCNDDILLITDLTVQSKYEMSNYQLVLTTNAVNQEAANYQHTDTKTSMGTKTRDKKSKKGSVSYPLCLSFSNFAVI